MRLKEILDLVPRTEIFADIGCDHGLLCKMVRDAHLADRILAADISEACLDKARALLGDDAEYFLGDGLYALNGILPDVTVISGMGGNTILRILENRLLPKVIISPQNDVFKVRKTLTESGYRITEDKVVTEHGKYYDIIALEPGEMRLNELQLTFGPFFTKNDPVFAARLRRDKGRLLSYKQTPSNIKKLKLIEQAEDLIRLRKKGVT